MAGQGARPGMYAVAYERFAFIESGVNLEMQSGMENA
jgi:hypothetical protein